MRLISLFARCSLFAACTNPPIFPSDVMKDVETNTFDVKAWGKQGSSLSSANFVYHNVELGGQIMRVIPNPGGIDRVVGRQADRDTLDRC